jgi:hypothetical protein
MKSFERRRNPGVPRCSNRSSDTLILPDTLIPGQCDGRLEGRTRVHGRGHEAVVRLEALITQQEAEIYLRAGILLVVGVLLWVVNYVVAGRTDELDAEAIKEVTTSEQRATRALAAS